MLAVKLAVALLQAGFQANEMGVFNGNDEKAKQALDYLAGGLTLPQVKDYLKADDIQRKSLMTTKKTASGKPQAELNPADWITKSASILETEVDFGGIKSTGFVDWNGMVCLTNTGTGRKANSLFVAFGKSDVGSDGVTRTKINMTEARAKIQTAQRTMENHLTVLEALDDYFKKLQES